MKHRASGTMTVSAFLAHIHTFTCIYTYRVYRHTIIEWNIDTWEHTTHIYTNTLTTKAFNTKNAIRKAIKCLLWLICTWHTLQASGEWSARSMPMSERVQRVWIPDLILMCARMRNEEMRENVISLANLGQMLLIFLFANRHYTFWNHVAIEWYGCYIDRNNRLVIVHV